MSNYKSTYLAHRVTNCYPYSLNHDILYVNAGNNLHMTSYDKLVALIIALTLAQAFAGCSQDAGQPIPPPTLPPSTIAAPDPTEVLKASIRFYPTVAAMQTTAAPTLPPTPRPTLPASATIVDLVKRYGQCWAERWPNASEELRQHRMTEALYAWRGAATASELARFKTWANGFAPGCFR